MLLKIGIRIKLSEHKPIEIIVFSQREQTMQCQGFACTRSFDTGVTSAEGQKLECFK